MRTGQLWKYLANLRAALVFALFVAASIPQLVGAHTQSAVGAQVPVVLHQVMMPHPDLVRATSGHCQLGQECSAMAVLQARDDGPQPAPVPDSAYQTFQNLRAGPPVSFDPPPPRIFL